MNRRLLACLAITVTAGCPDCGDLDRTGGNSQAGFFVAEVADIPVGARLDFRVQDYEFLQDADDTTVADVQSTAPDILAIEDAMEDGRITVRGSTVGEAAVTFVGVTDGEEVADRFDIAVREPGDIRMALCGQSTGGGVVRGTRVGVSYRVRTTNRQDLGGYGYYPVRVDPEGAATLRESESEAGRMVFEIGAQAPDAFEIRSTLPDALNVLPLVAVSPGDVGDVDVTAPTGSQYEGRQAVATFRARAGDVVVCEGLRWRVRVPTGGVCKLIVDEEEVELYEGTRSEVFLKYVGVGACELIVELIELAVSATVGWDVAELPSSSGGGDFD